MVGIIIITAIIIFTIIYAYCCSFSYCCCYISFTGPSGAVGISVIIIS